VGEINSDLISGGGHWEEWILEGGTGWGVDGSRRGLGEIVPPTKNNFGAGSNGWLGCCIDVGIGEASGNKRLVTK
jgi:hypothetical protein